MAAVVAVAVAGGGCTPWATYPPVEGAVELTGPKVEPIPTLMAESIAYAHERYARAQGELVINLPPGASKSVYDDVLEDLPGGARPMSAGDTAAYSVEQVRLRGRNAEVDLVVPRSDGFNEFLTLYLDQGFPPAKWVVKRTRLWRIRVAAPTANYPSPLPGSPGAAGAPAAPAPEGEVIATEPRTGAERPETADTAETPAAAAPAAEPPPPPEPAPEPEKP